MARRPSQPTNVPTRVSESRLDTGVTDQHVPSNTQDESIQLPSQAPTDQVLPSPAPSDDTPRIISISSTRRQSQDQQQPQTPLTLDLDGMGAAIIAHNRFLKECENQAAVPSVRTPLAAPEKRSVEFEDTSQPKRRATDFGPLTPAQSASPSTISIDGPVNGLDWKKFIQILDARLLTVRAQGLETYIISNRLRLLREACELEDVVYLAVHQVFCVNTIMKLKNPTSLPIVGIGILCQLLLKNETLDKESVEWFSTFPSSFPISPDTYLQEYNQVQIRLKLLEQNWSIFQKHFISLKTPPIDIDFITRLKITSPILQRIIYRCICRGFWPPSPEDSCLQGCFDLFTHYQTENRRWRAAQNISDGYRTRTLDSSYRAQRQECYELWQNHQNHVRATPQRTIPHQRPLSSGNSTQRTPVTLAARTTASSNATMHDTTPGLVPVIPSGPSQSHAFTPVEQQLWLNQMMQINSQQNPSRLTTFQSLAQSSQPASPTISSSSTSPGDIINPPARRRGRPPLRRISLPSNDVRMGSPLSTGVNNNAVPNPPNRGLQQGSGSPLRIVSQAQRQNSLPSTSPQSQPQFIVQRIPLQHQHQQRHLAVPSNAPPIQLRHPPVSLFRSIDYTGTPLHPITSTLHQAHLEESPISIAMEDECSEGGGSSKYLQYLDSFAVPPFFVNPQDRNRSRTFTVSSASFNLLAKPSKAYDAAQTPLRPGSQTYRLRCIKVPNPNETHFDKTGSVWSTQDTYWPTFIVLMLNDRHLEIRRKEVHGKDYYIEISDFIQEGENRLYISLLRSNTNPAKDIPTYAIAIEVLRIKSMSTAREEIGHLPEALTRAAILARLKPSDPDIEILSGAIMRLSLMDPISLQLIKSPVRGADCKHFECFDLEAFLSTRYDSLSPQCARPEAFRCPICGGDARPKVLLHDDWQMSVLMRYTAVEKERGVTSVVINETAEWKFDADKQDGTGKGGAKVKTEDGEDAQVEGREKEREVIVLD